MAVDEVDKNCAVCKKVVEEDEDAFLCDGFCKKWHHAKCVNIKITKFKKIQDVVDLILWMCQECTTRLSAMKSYSVDANEYFSLHSMVGNLLKIVKGVSEDNLNLNKKLDSIDQTNKNRYENLILRLPEVNNLTTPKPTVPIDNDKGRNGPSQIQTYDLTRTESSSSADTDRDRMNYHIMSENSSILNYDDITSEEVVQKHDVRITDGAYANEFPLIEASATRSKSANEWNTVSHKKRNKNSDVSGSENRGEGTTKVRTNQSKALYSSLIKSAAPRETKKITDNNSTVIRPGSQKNRRPLPVVVGSSTKECNLTGTKRAWFHLGKIQKGTNQQEVESFVKNTFPGINVSVENSTARDLMTVSDLVWIFQEKRTL